MHSKLYLFSQKPIYIYMYIFSPRIVEVYLCCCIVSCKTLTGIHEWKRWHSKFAAKYHLLLVTAHCGKASSNATSRMGKHCPRLQIWIPRFPAQFKHGCHCPLSENQQWSEQDGHILLSTPPSFEPLQSQPYRITPSPEINRLNWNGWLWNFGMIYCLNLHSINIYIYIYLFI